MNSGRMFWGAGSGFLIGVGSMEIGAQTHNLWIGISVLAIALGLAIRVLLGPE